MNDERWTIVDRLLDAALAREPRERAAFLADACAGDDELRREVESLLAHEREAAGFMSTPAAALAGAVVSHGTLVTGRQVGPYAIHERLGAGGMGEVYRGRDTKLGREVAIKTLPRIFSIDPERRSRFDREARLLASLNHPHIGAIYGVEDVDGTPALILELVDGDTLAERLARSEDRALHDSGRGRPSGRPLPIGEALNIAGQIAEALEAAHEKGIVHRDLKPANIKITPDGIVKVLDFGLAKAASGDASGPDLTHSPTVTIDGTRDGVILGTAAYMSPEQARGKPVDKRTDIWAFGCVLYEMLTGGAVFGRDTVTDTLAAIVERDPDWRALPPATPPSVTRLLQRCLDKDPKRRLHDIADARIEIEDALGAPRSTETRAVTVGRRGTVAWVVAGAILAGVIAVGMLRFLRQQPAVLTADLLLSVAPPAATGIQSVEGLATPEISPDGSFVAYRDRSGTLQLRRLNAILPEPIRAIGGSLTIAWSPDSKSLMFADGTDVKRMRVPDGAPETIGRTPDRAAVGSVSDSGSLLIVCCPVRSTLYLLAASATEAKEIALPGLITLPGLRGSLVDPRFLPDGEDFLVGYRPPASEETDLYLVTWRDGNPADPVLLMKNAAAARYTPAGGGRVLFMRNDNLYAQRLNRQARRVEGDPELVQRGVASKGTAGHFSVSRSGVIAWRPGRAAVTQVTLFDRQGRPIGTAGGPSYPGSLKLSPDEQHVLVAARDGRAWVLEPNQPGRLNVSHGHLNMLWSPDGSGFLVPEGSRIVERPIRDSSDGRELASAPGLDRLDDVSADGTEILFRDSTFASPLFSSRIDDVAKARVPRIVQAGESISNARFSPDARWIVYQVDAPRPQIGIYVQPFPDAGLRRKQITSTGESPVWRRDGQEIVYLDQDRIWSVRVDTSSDQVRVGVPEPLFSVRSTEGGRRVPGISQLAVSRDGSRIYYQQPVEQPDSDVIHVRMGWEGAAGR